VLAACIAPALAIAATPAALLRSMLAAARTQHSVHYVSNGHFGPARIVQVGDVGDGKGIQRITFNPGGQTGHVVVIVAAGKAYVRGDAFTLVNFMGFNAAPAKKYAGRWVMIPHSDRDFATVADDVTLATTVAHLTFPGTLGPAPKIKIAGRAAVGVQWQAMANGKPVVSALYAPASGKPLPIQERSANGTDGVTITYSGWNAPLHIAVPKSAVPIAKTGLE
jgi:hypothetical protein